MLLKKKLKIVQTRLKTFSEFIFIHFINTILREDSNYKLSLRETKNKDSYECKYILSTLKSLISLYNFNRQKYSGEEDEIKAVFEEIFRTFQKLDGTIKVKDKEELENSIKQANLIISQNLRKYEIAWKESYSKLITLLKIILLIKQKFHKSQKHKKKYLVSRYFLKQTIFDCSWERQNVTNV